MRLFRTRVHAYVALVLPACVVIAAIVILLLPRERVTRANFEKIEIGMSVADVQTLLGPPENEFIQSIAVLGPTSYTTYLGPQDERGLPFHVYTRQRWNSSELGIDVISDAKGRVVCRCSGKAYRRATVFDIVWFWLIRHF